MRREFTLARQWREGTGNGSGQGRINEALNVGAPDEVIEQITREVEGTSLAR